MILPLWLKWFLLWIITHLFAVIGVLNRKRRQNNSSGMQTEITFVVIAIAVDILIVIQLFHCL